jgi:hypothetical protein
MAKKRATTATKRKAAANGQATAGTPKAGVDRFGNKLGTQANSINVAILSANGPVTVDHVSAVTGFNKGRVKNHFTYLVKKGLVETVNTVRVV